MARKLYEIGEEIVSLHRKSGKTLPFGSAPYVQAMRALGGMEDSYGYDDAESVVIYGLSNLQNWRGEDAKRVKHELRVMLHEHNPRRHKMPK